jgi:hypothetical protein
MGDTDLVASALAVLGKQPSLFFEEVTFTTEREVEEGEESDDDESVAPEEEQQEAGDESVDTQMATQIAAQPERRYAEAIYLPPNLARYRGTTWKNRYVPWRDESK